MNKHREYIKMTLTFRERCEQLAEECNELAQASLKLIRASGMSNNPTPVTLTDAYENLREELADVLVCASLVAEIPDIDDNPKWERWANRLRGVEDDGRRGEDKA